MSDELDDIFSKDDVENIIVQEGLQTIQELFEFFNEALDVAVQWITHHETSLSEDGVRAIISEQVSGKTLEEIVDKLAALTEIQEDL